MFDVNQQIGQWRQSLGQSESVIPSDLDELESHLRDQIDHLAAAGLSQQEAFYIAQQRIGDALTLPMEFAKVNGSAIFRRRLQWMLAGVLAYLLILHLSQLAFFVGVLASSAAGFHGYVTGWIGQIAKCLTGLAGLAIGLIAMKSPRVLRRIGSDENGLILGLIAAVGIILLIVARLFISALTVRYAGADAYGKSAIVERVSTLSFSVLIPILMLWLLILLRTSWRRREIGVN